MSYLFKRNRLEGVGRCRATYDIDKELEQTMALLASESGPTIGGFCARQKRTSTLSTKLTEAEFDQAVSLCNSLQVAPSEWLRDIVLWELRGNTNDTKRVELMLSELVRIRLMFINLLRPRNAEEGPLTPEAFDSMLAKIKATKNPIAQRMLAELEVKHEQDSVG
jgi:hypothetical protein